MPKRSTSLPPTDEEILALSNVRLDVAAKYIGWSSPTLRYALQEERAPFGIAARNPETGTWAYNISPGALVAYKHGDLPTYRLQEVIRLAADGIEQLLDTRLAAAATPVPYV